ncbi:MAG: K(+)-transporting ATPase subunit F [Oscillospiraceae bacterium]
MRRNTGEQELNSMILLGTIVLLLGGYLVYALAHPERF